MWITWFISLLVYFTRHSVSPVSRYVRAVSSSQCFSSIFIGVLPYRGFLGVGLRSVFIRPIADPVNMNSMFLVVVLSLYRRARKWFTPPLMSCTSSRTTISFFFFDRSRNSFSSIFVATCGKGLEGCLESFFWEAFCSGFLGGKGYIAGLLLGLGGFCLGWLLDRIAVNPRVMAGKPVIRGTRVMVDLVLELLAAGMEPEEIAEDYGISVEDVRAALLYAARVLGREEVLIVSEA